MTNRVKELLRAGRPAVGHWLSLPSPAVAELMAGCGMDWLVIDTEHGPADYERVEDLLRAVNGTPAVPLVRVADNSPALIKKALDRGALGVLVPLVDTPEAAAAAVAASRYPPEGIRGVAGTRASRFGLDLESYVESWNREVLVAVQIETRRALDNVERIAVVPGVDVLFVGPNDLSAGLGLFQRFDHPEYIRAVARILGAANDHGIAAGYMCAGAESTLAKIDEGFRFVAAGTDARLLAGAARALYGAIHEGLARRVPGSAQGLPATFPGQSR